MDSSELVVSTKPEFQNVYQCNGSGTPEDEEANIKTRCHGKAAGHTAPVCSSEEVVDRPRIGVVIFISWFKSDTLTKYCLSSMENCDISGSKKEQMLSLFLEKPCKIDTIFIPILLTRKQAQRPGNSDEEEGDSNPCVWVSVVSTAMPLLMSLADWPLSVDHRYPND